MYLVALGKAFCVFPRKSSTWLSGDPESRFWVPLGAFWAPFDHLFHPFCMFLEHKKSTEKLCGSLLVPLGAIWVPFKHFCDTWTAVTCVLLMSARLGPGILGVWSGHLVMVV